MQAEPYRTAESITLADLNLWLGHRPSATDPVQPRDDGEIMNRKAWGQPGEPVRTVTLRRYVASMGASRRAGGGHVHLAAMETVLSHNIEADLAERRAAAARVGTSFDEAKTRALIARAMAPGAVRIVQAECNGNGAITSRPAEHLPLTAVNCAKCRKRADHLVALAVAWLNGPDGEPYRRQP